MLKLHYRIKFRAAFITFGTIENTVDVTAVFVALLVKLLPGLAAQIGPALSSLASPHTLVNANGVLIEVAS